MNFIYTITFKKKKNPFRIGQCEFSMGVILRKSLIAYHKLPVEKGNTYAIISAIIKQARRS